MIGAGKACPVFALQWTAIIDFGRAIGDAERKNSHRPGRTLWEFLCVGKWELRQYRNSRNVFKAMAWLLGW